jgi:hypothetical protein
MSTHDQPTCRSCGSPLTGLSADFCSETCQATWHGRRTDDQTAMDGDRRPDASLPEAPPVRPLTWLDGPSDQRPGHAVLDEVAGFVRRFSVFPDEHCAPVLALWYAHTHVVDRFYITPRIILDSAEAGSGKTRVLEVAALLCRAPEMTISATTAALFRLVSSGPVSILFDEIDAIFNGKAGANEDLRGLLNAGYKRSATVARCVGDAKNMTVQRFPVFAPAMLAGIAGGMPDTITTRAITIHMRRRRPDEHAEPFRERTARAQAAPILKALTDWLDTVADAVAEAEPVMPEGVTDRPAEIWEPLLAIADAAGDHWPTTARKACQHFVIDAGPQTTSPGIRLLADLRVIYAERDTDRLTTVELITSLCALDDAPWGDFGDRPLDARRLARELGRYGVSPVSFKANGASTKGYVTYATDRQAGLADAWKRYLPQPGNSGDCGNPAGPAVTATHPVTAKHR